MFTEGWMSERWRVLSALLIVIVLGLFTGLWVMSIGTVTLGLLLWHARQLTAYERWIRGGGSIDREPVASGIWRELVGQITRVHKRYRLREQRLKKVIEQLETTISALPDSAVVLGENREIIWANRVSERCLGIRFPGDRGVRISNLIRDPEFIDFLNKKSEIKSMNMESPTTSEQYLNISIVPYGETAFLLTARDVSELIRADAMRHDFVSNASHELKTPLTVVTGYMELLEQEVDDDLKHLIRSSAEQTQRMQYLVDDLLALSRLETRHSPHYEDVNVAAVLENIAHEARQLSGDHNHQIYLDVDANLTLKASHEDIFSAFSNLVLI